MEFPQNGLTDKLMAFTKFNQIELVGMATAVPQATVAVTAFEGKIEPTELDRHLNQNGPAFTRKAIEAQTTSDLGYDAAKNLLEAFTIPNEAIGILLFISKTPDYRSPATAIVLQHRLGLTTSCLAFDCNIGGIGFENGLQVAGSLLATTSTSYALVVVGDTTTKQFEENNLNQLVYSDACSAVLLKKSAQASLMQIATYANGATFDSLFIEKGGYRGKTLTKGHYQWNATDLAENNFIFWDKPIFYETIQSKIRETLPLFLEKCQVNPADFDAVLFPTEGHYLEADFFESLGFSKIQVQHANTGIGLLAGATTPFLLEKAAKFTDKKEARILSINFGEGLSWAYSDFVIVGSAVLPTHTTAAFFEDGAVTHEM